jgi:hypothetical protein
VRAARTFGGSGGVATVVSAPSAAGSVIGADARGAGRARALDWPVKNRSPSGPLTICHGSPPLVGLAPTVKRFSTVPPVGRSLGSRE